MIVAATYRPAPPIPATFAAEMDLVVGPAGYCWRSGPGAASPLRHRSGFAYDKLASRNETLAIAHPAYHAWPGADRLCPGRWWVHVILFELADEPWWFVGKDLGDGC